MSEIGLNINVDSYNNEGIKTIKGNNNAEIYKLYILKNKRRLSLVGKTVKLGYVMAGTTNGDVIENLNITNAEQGEITFPITNRISKQDGVYSCQLAIYGADGFLEHTATFGLTVEDNIFTKIAGEIADSKDFTYLENILDKASKLSEKLKENTSTATNANSNLESNITEANNINSKLLENTSTATSLNKNLESNIDLAKEVKETIKDLDNKNTEATSKIKRLEGLNAKAEELSDNINKGLPLNSELIKNVESAKTANNELIATNNDAKAKKTDLDNSLEEAKKYISGLDGSKNPVQMQLDIDMLKNGLKSNQALAYKGSSISANDTLEGRTEGMRIGGRTLVNISPKGISDCSSISAFNHNYQEVKVEQGDGFVKCTQPLAKKYNILGYDNVNMLKTNTYYLHMAYVEILNNPSNDTCEFQLGNFDIFKTIKISQGKGIVAALTKTHSNLSGGNSKWISLMLGNLNSAGENRSFKVFNIATYEISEKEASLEIESLIKLYPIKCNGMKSFGESEREDDKYKISILSTGKNIYNGEDLYIYKPEEKWRVIEVSNTPKFELGKSYKVSYKTTEKVILKIILTYQNGEDAYSSSESPLIVAKDKGQVTKLRFYIEESDYSTNKKFVITNIQIEEGTKPTSYEHYKENKKDVLISTPLEENDIMYEDNGQVKISRNAHKYKLTGDENWFVYDLAENIRQFYIQPLEHLAVNNRDAINCISSTLPSCKYNDRTNLVNHIYCNTNLLAILKPKSTTLEEFKSWLKANPTTIVYQLATPTVEIVENCIDIDLDTYQEKTYFNILNSLPGTLDFKVPSNIGSVVQNMAKEVNNIWDVINNLLVPSIVKANGNLAMIKLNNNLK